MTNKDHIENLVKETMESLEGIQKAEPRPFFFTRLQARLMRVENSVWERISSFVARPAIAVGIVTIILLLNTWVFVTKMHSENAGSATMAGQTEVLGSEEYGIAAANYYYFDENQ